jgi:hypothetical protein
VVVERESDLPSQVPLTVDKAWLLGFMAGDGHIQWNEGQSYKVFTNCGPDKALAEAVANLFRELYDVPCSVLWQDNTGHGNRIGYWYTHCSRKSVAYDLRSVTVFGTYVWRVPVAILSGSPELKAAWVSGFADADGSAVYHPKRSQRGVSLSSVNVAGLDQVCQILTDLGIAHARSSHDREIEGHAPEHKVHVCFSDDLKRFAQLVGFRSPEKQALLTQAVGSYKHRTARSGEVQSWLGELRARREIAGQTYEEIAEGMAALGLSKERVRATIRHHMPDLVGPHGGRTKGKDRPQAVASGPALLPAADAFASASLLDTILSPR